MAGARPVLAQQPSIWIDALASSARPPAGVVDRSVGVYGLMGARAQWTRPSLSLSASTYLGLGARRQEGRWGALSLTGNRDHSLGPFLGDLELELFGLRYTDPYRFTALSATARPSLSYRFRGFELIAGGDLSLGRWSSRIRAVSEEPGLPVQPQPPAAIENSGPLRVAAARARLVASVRRGTVTLGTVFAQAVNGRSDGRYQGVNANVLQIHNNWDVMLDGQLLKGPQRTELGGSLRIGRLIEEGVYVSAEINRSVADFTLGAPGHTGATIGVSWRPSTPRPIGRPAFSIVRVGAEEDRGTRVEFRLPKTAASSVALLGSFTEWEPRAMSRTSDGWTISLVVPQGSHQFAFMLDGQRWYLPDGAPGVIADGFGRRNATIVIGPAS
ncbi:MAG: hypothetical protein ACREMA_12420 [Longimicrobiales bacterium]